MLKFLDMYYCLYCWGTIGPISVNILSFFYFYLILFRHHLKILFFYSKALKTLVLVKKILLKFMGKKLKLMLLFKDKIKLINIWQQLFTELLIIKREG